MIKRLFGKTIKKPSKKQSESPIKTRKEVPSISSITVAHIRNGIAVDNDFTLFIKKQLIGKKMKKGEDFPIKIMQWDEPFRVIEITSEEDGIIDKDTKVKVLQEPNRPTLNFKHKSQNKFYQITNTGNVSAWNIKYELLFQSVDDLTPYCINDGEIKQIFPDEVWDFDLDDEYPHTNCIMVFSYFDKEKNGNHYSGKTKTYHKE